MEGIKQVFKETIQYVKEPKVYKEMGLGQEEGWFCMVSRNRENYVSHNNSQLSRSILYTVFWFRVLGDICWCGPQKDSEYFQNSKIIALDTVGSRTDQWQTKEQRSTVNQLLCEIDGFEQNYNIFVIAATNNLPAVDRALLWPGRFDLKVFVPPPSQEDRAGILKAILAKKHVLHQLTQNDLQELAKLSQNWTGAHLQNLINQSLYSAIRHKQNQLFHVRVFETIKQLNNKQ